MRISLYNVLSVYFKVIKDKFFGYSLSYLCLYDNWTSALELTLLVYQFRELEDFYKVYKNGVVLAYHWSIKWITVPTIGQLKYILPLQWKFSLGIGLSLVICVVWRNFLIGTLKSFQLNLIFYVSCFSRDFSIVIDGIVGRSYLSDIGLDGIKLLDGKFLLIAFDRSIYPSFYTAYIPIYKEVTDITFLSIDKSLLFSK